MIISEMKPEEELTRQAECGEPLSQLFTEHVVV